MFKFLFDGNYSCVTRVGGCSPCQGGVVRLMRNKRDAYLCRALPVEPKLLPRELCCSVPKGPPLWFATQGFQVNQILGLPLVHTKPPSCSQWRLQQNTDDFFQYIWHYYYFMCQVCLFFFLLKIKIFSFMKWGGKLTFFLQRSITLLLAENKSFFSSITDKNHCICGFMIGNTGY